MLDERTRAILTRIHDDYGDNWLEGVLNSLEAWRAEMHLAELEIEELAGDNPAAFEALLEQTAASSPQWNKTTAPCEPTRWLC